MKIHQRTQTVQIQTAILVHGRHNRYQTAFKHEAVSRKKW
jgi:hypothetical protein